MTARCSIKGYADLDYATWNASYEIVEAATNPTGTGWTLTTFDASDPNGGGVAAMCAQSRTSDGYLVAALYSNQAAKSDQRFCLPAPPGPMFRAYASPDEIDVAAGGTVTTTIRFYSTAPLPKPLTLRVYPFPKNLVSAQAGVTQLANGDQTPLQITVGASAKSSDYLLVYLTVMDGTYETDSYVLLHAH